MEKEKFVNKIDLPILYISIWVILYNLPREIYHVGGNNGIEGWLLGITTFLILPFLLFKTLRRNGFSKDSSKGLAYGSVFLMFPFVLLIQSEDDKELEIYQKETIGIINKAWMMNRRKKKSIWAVQAEYKIEGKTYQTSSKDDKDMTLSLGDTVTIIYSSKTPQMHEIKELKQYYGK